MAALLLMSIPVERRSQTSLLMGIDMKDPVYDDPDGTACARIDALFGGLSVSFHYLSTGGANFFVLLGDDVHLFPNGGWQDDVEGCFAQVAEHTGLPFGVACVAIRDSTFENFPTFPVLHKSHLDIFGGHLFPNELTNQHGDPWCYEVYRRYGASRFTTRETSRLENRRVGASASRYEKVSAVVWRDKLLTQGIETVERWLVEQGIRAQRVPCIDLIVPTYRCDKRALSAICALSGAASLYVLLVVDKPDVPNLQAIKDLAGYEYNHIVRYYVMSQNSGASTVSHPYSTRNAGLAQSVEDHAILLDDDVLPDKGLMDAYLSAIARHPEATIFVGNTELPPPASLAEHALVASGITYFYGIAARTPRLPWGVTANLEDVDFCLRQKHHHGASVVSVPHARVIHPFWPRPLAQVVGWACGDVFCLEQLPWNTFGALPNWYDACDLVWLCVLAVCDPSMCDIVRVSSLYSRSWSY
ncbi:hypothetical protein T492DRAFT_1116365 [Pavlovales sp. CCMP2436]|nr:hypothetical protein T492DRAFT_1116365 [Pavlovales sp. CCMP2436]